MGKPVKFILVHFLVNVVAEKSLGNWFGLEGFGFKRFCFVVNAGI